MTGIMDHPILSGVRSDYDGQLEEWLTILKDITVETNKEWAEKLGINPSTAITCVNV